MITLTQEERDKFSSWLNQEADAEEAIVRQMEKLAIPEIMIKRYKILMAARRLLANHLTATEDMTL